MQDAVDKLFKTRFFVEVEERAFYTDEILEHVGIMGVNTIEEAHVVMSRLRPIRASLVEIAEYHDKGFKIKITHQSDVPEMFNILNTHMDNWLKVCQRMGYVSMIPPIKDFEMLDALAEKFFPYRKADKAITEFLTLLKSPLATGVNYMPKNGMYKPYSPLLYKYCKMVWGE